VLVSQNVFGPQFASVVQLLPTVVAAADTSSDDWPSPLVGNPLQAMAPVTRRNAAKAGRARLRMIMIDILLQKIV
jgi:hypothetical protein